MRRSPLVTPAHRDQLLRSKLEFDAACAAVDDFSDRSSPAFQAAQDLYRIWIKAIDSAALALLSDLDALDVADADRSPAGDPGGARSPVEAIRPGEVDHVFAELDDLQQARAIVTDDEEVTVDIFGP